MVQINARGWILQVNIEATMLHYETAATDLCDCAYCRNYVAAFPNHFPEEFLDILQNMMIDPLKPDHVSEVCSDNNNNHMYIGNYDFVGTILHESNEQHQSGERFSIDVIGSIPNPNIQFSVKIPWILDEEVASVSC